MASGGELRPDCKRSSPSTARSPSGAELTASEMKRSKEEIQAGQSSDGADARFGPARNLDPLFLFEAHGTPVVPAKKLFGADLYEAIFDRDLCPYFEEDLVDIHVPLLRMFFTVIDRMGGGEPRFSYNTSLNKEVYVTVKFEVPARYTTTKTACQEEISGDPFTDVQLAEDSAFRRCFEHLAREYRVFLVDFSARQADEYDEKALAVHSQVKGFSDSVDGVIQQWNSSIDRILRFETELRRKVKTQETHYQVVSEAGKVYGEAANSLIKIARKSMEQLRLLSAQRQQYGTDLKDFLDMRNGRLQDIRYHGEKKKVYFHEKDVLAYVLECLKRPVPEYKNKLYTDRYMFRGYVIVDLAEVERVNCSGRIEIKGDRVKETSMLAEEHAAGNAIRFLESKYKLQVKDLNYEERVLAKGRAEHLASLEWKFKEIGDQVILKWSNMVEYLKATYEMYAFPIITVTDAPKRAMDFCANGILKLHQEAMEAMKVASASVKEMKGIPLDIDI
ncbi:hypothetical protein ACP70R_040716 [Stipagrostis hirtigluma subsp. patula]